VQAGEQVLLDRKESKGLHAVDQAYLTKFDAAVSKELGDLHDEIAGIEGVSLVVLTRGVTTP
jgi:hypothetical protein